MTDAGKILVTGATGNTGSILVPTLLHQGVNVRAFVRDEAKARPWAEKGAEIAVGDLNEPETIQPAVEGVDKIYLCTWNGPTQLQHVENVVNAARQAGNPHIVRHSMWGSEKSRIVQQGEEAEQTVKASGLPWTILQPTFFMQNLMGTAQTIASDGVFYWDLDDAEVAMIDVRDVADSAAGALTGTGHEGQTYILTGPEAISLHDAADAFSDVLDKDVNYVPVPHEAALESRLDMGFPEWIARGYGELMEGFIEGFADRAHRGVEKLTGRPPRSFEQFARDHQQIFHG